MKLPALLLSFLLLPACVFAQTATGVILGRVVDPTGSAIAGAELQLINQQTRDTRRLLSGGDGDFLFLDVHPGTYTLVVKFEGFKQHERSNLNLSPSDRLSVGELRLEV